jgi:hypothetical protein
MAGRIGSVQRAQADVRPKAAALAARNDVHTLAAMDEWADELIRGNRMLLQLAKEASARTAEIARRPTARRGVNRHAQLHWYRDYQNWLAPHAWERPSGSDRPEPSSAG